MLHSAPCDGSRVWLQTALNLHTVKKKRERKQPFKLGSSACVCECVVCGVMAHCSPTQARRDAHDALGFETPRAIHLPATGQRQRLPAPFGICVFVFGVDLQLLSFPHSPHAVKWLRERSALKSLRSVGTNHALIVGLHTS